MVDIQIFISDIYIYTTGSTWIVTIVQKYPKYLKIQKNYLQKNYNFFNILATLYKFGLLLDYCRVYSIDPSK